MGTVPLRDVDGRIVKWLGTNTEIDDLKRAEKALRASEKAPGGRLDGHARLQEVSTRLVGDGDPNPPLLEIVDAAIAITGSDMGNIQLYEKASGTLEIAASRGFDPAFLEYFETVHNGAACGAAMQAGKRVVVEDVSNSPIFAGTSALDVMLAAGVHAVQSTPLFGRSGRLVGMISTHYRTPSRPADRDLHVLDLLARQAADWVDRTDAEEALHVANAHLDLAVRSSSIGTWEVNMPEGIRMHGTFTSNNFWEQLGYSPIRVPIDISAWMAAVHPNDIEKTNLAFDAYLAGETKECEIETRYLDKDGSHRWMLTRGMAMRDGLGQPVGLIGTIQDITEHKRAEQELKRAKEAAEAANGPKANSWPTSATRSARRLERSSA